MERKLAPQFTKSIDDRTVVGVFAVHGNIDDYSDRSWPGSFANTTIEGRNRARFLWMHRSEDPPIAVIRGIRELARDELPTSVLSYAPMATGGVEVTREYLDTPRGNEVLTGIKAGAIQEMSYAYDVTRSDFEEVDGVQVRNLREIKLFDVSDVTWGANSATVAVKSGLESGLPFDQHISTVVSAVDGLVERTQRRMDARVKAGRRFSAASVKEMESAIEDIQTAMTTLKNLLASASPETEEDAGKMLRELHAQSAALRLNSAYVLGVLAS